MRQAVVPSIISKHASLTMEVLAFLGGVMGMALLAQLEIRLPWTPVPITGQTFGVALVALTYGRKRAAAVLASYLALGSLGAPVFSLGQSGLSIPTLGYLFGMLVAANVVGFLADRGFARSFGKALLAAYVGSFFIFGFGLLGLALFVGSENLLAAGLFPFLLGDLIKNTSAAWIASRANKLID